MSLTSFPSDFLERQDVRKIILDYNENDEKSLISKLSKIYSDCITQTEEYQLLQEKFTRLSNVRRVEYNKHQKEMRSKQQELQQTIQDENDKIERGEKKLSSLR